MNWKWKITYGITLIIIAIAGFTFDWYFTKFKYNLLEQSNHPVQQSTLDIQNNDN